MLKSSDAKPPLPFALAPLLCLCRSPVEPGPVLIGVFCGDVSVEMGVVEADKDPLPS